MMGPEGWSHGFPMKRIKGPWRGPSFFFSNFQKKIQILNSKTGNRQYRTGPVLPGFGKIGSVFVGKWNPGAAKGLDRLFSNQNNFIAILVFLWNIRICYSQIDFLLWFLPRLWWSLTNVKNVNQILLYFQFIMAKIEFCDLLINWAKLNFWKMVKVWSFEQSGQSSILFLSIIFFENVSERVFH